LKGVLNTGLICLLAATISFCQLNNGSDSHSAKQKIGSPIVLNNDTLFVLNSGIGAFSAKKRAEEINSIIKNLAEDYDSVIDSIKFSNSNGVYLIHNNNLAIMGITAWDTLGTGKTIDQLGGDYLSRIKSKLVEHRELFSRKSIIANGVKVLVSLIAFVFVMWLLRFVFSKISTKLEEFEEKYFKSLSIRNTVVLKSNHMLAFTLNLLQGLWLFISFFLFYLFVSYALTNLPWTHHLNFQPILRSALIFILFSIFTLSMVKGVNFLYRFFVVKLQRWKGSLVSSIKVKSLVLLSDEKAVALLIYFTKIIRTFLVVAIFYFYLTISFSLFLFSQKWGGVLFNYISNPIGFVGNAFLKFLPSLFFIIIIIVVFRYLLKIVKFVFDEIGCGNLNITGFYVDWAAPTYKIVRFLTIILALIIIFPYLPGSDSDAFKGISVFLGILFSIGSSSAISNMVSGIVLTYMRPFVIGDRVKIADTVGDVVEKSLLVTRIKTIKNIEITIPNSMVLSSHIINYSTAIKNNGLILHTTVTIGYDAPWKKVHELLIAAAIDTENVLSKPEPFVLQTSLNDFYISYEINCYTDKPQNQSLIYSELHSKIQDKFNEAGVEIMSPHYSNVRDGNKTTVPDEYLPKDYRAPGFNLFGLDFSRNSKKD